MVQSRAQPSSADSHSSKQHKAADHTSSHEPGRQEKQASPSTPVPNTSPVERPSRPCARVTMASPDHSNPLAESGITIHTDSERYSATEDVSASPPSSSSSPIVLYKPPTIWSIIRGTAINLLLPFVNGMMLGFGELFAHEAAFRLGWGGTKVGSRGLHLPAGGAILSIMASTNSSSRSSPCLGGGPTPSARVSRSPSGGPGGASYPNSRVWSNG